MKTYRIKMWLVAALIWSGAAIHTAFCQPATIPNAHGAWLTTTLKGNLVMSWVEGDPHEERGIVKYAVSRDGGRTFGPSVCVPASRGASTAHGECPPKIAFRADGTVVVMYRLSQPTENNPHAGDVYYVYSKDNGKSWSEASTIGAARPPAEGFLT